MNQFKKFLFGFLALQCLAFSPLAIAPAKAQVELWDSTSTTAFTDTGLSNKDPRVIIADLIKVVLGFLGTVAVILVIYSGFLWMTAGGKQDNIKKAKDIMSAAVVGLIIILISYGITLFVTSTLSSAIN
ncbi:MAG TPA: hypothetical protein PKN62_02375 [bacterium]|nr:hypothetical protein [bacterium]